MIGRVLFGLFEQKGVMYPITCPMCEVDILLSLGDACVLKNKLILYILNLSQFHHLLSLKLMLLIIFR